MSSDNFDPDELLRQAARRAIDSVPPKPMPPWFYGTPPPRNRTGRLVVYGMVAAAATVAIVFAVAVLQTPDVGPADTNERAAAPTSPATTQLPSPVAGDTPLRMEAQIEADTAIAEGFGLTLGPTVFADDGSMVLGDQPDLTPTIIDDIGLAGYARSADVFAGDDRTGYYVYGPDGETIRGVMDLVAGYTPIEDDPPPPSIPGADE